MPFTAAELAEMAAADAEIEATFHLTAETQSRRYQRNKEEFIKKQKELCAENRKKLYDTQWKIKLFRKSLKMTQRDFGALLGISGKTVSKWERGNSPARWDKLESVFPGLQEKIRRQ